MLFYFHIIKAAFKLGNKKWGITFALLFVCSVTAYFVGLIACGIGIYATTSFIFLPSYLVYKKVVGFSEVEDAIARIGVN